MFCFFHNLPFWKQPSVYSFPSIEKLRTAPYGRFLLKQPGKPALIINKSKVIKMMNFRKVFGGIFCLTVGVLTMVSCDKKDSIVDPLLATVDVYVQDLKGDPAVKYGVVINVTTNFEIKSAKVTAPGTGGKVYNLVATNKKQFVLIPAAADYTTELPVKGDYTFEIVSTMDEKVTGKDVVGDEKLTPISIKTAVITNHLLKTTWDKVSNADAYVVNFYSADKSTLLFSGSLLASDKVEYEFGSTTSGWATGKSPVVNTDYVVELIGVKYETGVTSDKGSNIQFKTLDSKTIKWE